jgi:large subunit ribosomal protein L28
MKICEICGRIAHRGRQISRRGLAKKKGGVGKKITGISHRTFKPNLQRVRAVVKGQVTRIRVCAACIRAGKVIKPAVKYRPPKLPVPGAAPVTAGAAPPGAVESSAAAPPQPETPPPAAPATEAKASAEESPNAPAE